VSAAGHCEMAGGCAYRTRTPFSRLWYDQTKRTFDIAASAIGLVVTAPIMGITAALVKCKLGSPVIFSQERPGKDGRIFRIHKFRTMLAPDPARGLVDDEDRLTPFGAKLRSTSLDELPELVNVLVGDMSLVGPRPLLKQYLPLYSCEQRRRHEVRPGITGLAQCSGRNALSWEDKFRLDVQYVDNRSWRIDCRIMLQTLVSVIRRDGISAHDHPTMQFFAGAQSEDSDPAAVV